MGRGNLLKQGWQESLSEEWSFKSRPEKWRVSSEKMIVLGRVGVPMPRKSLTGTRNGKGEMTGMGWGEA